MIHSCLALRTYRPCRALPILAATAAIVMLLANNLCAQPVTGWLSWRGPHQSGISDETNLPSSWTPNGESHLWAVDLPGRGTPVIARYGSEDRLYAMGYRGEGFDLLEVLVCMDARTGSVIWERAFPDFMSDIIYDRYSIGAPTVDPQTGNIYVLTSPGLLICFDRDGNLRWQRSMMEEFGRLTFPNGRTGAPAIDGDLVIVNCITSNWGREGPARNRFYAFNKDTGELVWSSTPGLGPPYLKDSSFSMPVFAWRGAARIMYCATGCGNIIAVNARTGDPLWRFQFAIGGVNSSVLLHENRVIAVHGVENVDTSMTGRMVAIPADIPAASDMGVSAAPAVVEPSAELWRNDSVSMFSSSPTLVDGVVYQVTASGELVAVDAATGDTRWKMKLGVDQLHASPLYADGKLYVPTWHDGFFILKPGDKGAEVLANVKLKGDLLGSPSVWNGRIYVHTTQRLYCFGRSEAAEIKPAPSSGTAPPARDPARLQPVPAEVLMKPDQKLPIKVNVLDAFGQYAGQVNQVSWKPVVPPGAMVAASMSATFDDTGAMATAPSAVQSAGAFEVSSGELKGQLRGRVVPAFPYAEDFESFALLVSSQTEPKYSYAYPPLPWIGARMKWEVRDIGGTNVLAKTLDNILFQRAVVFFGHPADSGYVVEADVMSDGDRRSMSCIGVVNQRYIIMLDGNKQVLCANSNYDRFSHEVRYPWKPKTWYRLKTRVSVASDGSGVVRAKAWPRGDAEPDHWMLEATHPHAHRSGSPGIFGFTPGSKFAVYVDNISVTQAE